MRRGPDARHGPQRVLTSATRGKTKSRYWPSSGSTQGAGFNSRLIATAEAVKKGAPNEPPGEIAAEAGELIGRTSRGGIDFKALENAAKQCASAASCDSLGEPSEPGLFRPRRSAIGFVLGKIRLNQPLLLKEFGRVDTNQ